MTIINGQVASAPDVLAGYGNPLAQLAYEQVKSDSTEWTNTDYLGADIFTSAAGAKTTVDETNTDSYYDIDNNNYSGLQMNIGNTDSDSGFTNPTNFFDNDDATLASKTATYGSGGDQTVTWVLGKYWTEDTYIGDINIKAYLGFSDMWTGGSDGTITLKLQSYDGSTWSDVTTLYTGTSGGSDFSHTYDDIYEANITTKGIRLSSYFFVEGNTGVTILAQNYLCTIQGGADSTVETNSIISDIVPDSIVVYGKTTLPTGTSITVDVSDDGGSTFALTAKALNTPIDTSSFTTGNLAFNFNLATTDTSVTPKLYGYGVAITDK